MFTAIVVTIFYIMIGLGAFHYFTVMIEYPKRPLSKKDKYIFAFLAAIWPFLLGDAIANMATRR